MALAAAQPAEHPLLMLRAAIDMVASGGALRVTLVGQDGEALLPAAQALARESGVIARGIWHENGGGCDIAVEPLD